MSILDVIAPRKGPKQRRLTVTFFAKFAFIGTVLVFMGFALASVFTFGQDTTIPTIPETRTADEVVQVIEDFLKTQTHRGFLNQDEPSSCWDIFQDKEITATYLRHGSWQVDAYYERIRYYWRVDDLSLEVTQDDWVQTRRDVFKRNYTKTIEC
jgi:hypothetical protein